jgi:hypothetical protein
MGNLTQVKETFAEFNFSLSQMTALMGAHTVGSASYNNSGYSGSWAPPVGQLSNSFYVNLVNLIYSHEDVGPSPYSPRQQFTGPSSTVALHTDMSLYKDFPVDYSADNVTTVDGCVTTDDISPPGTSDSVINCPASAAADYVGLYASNETAFFQAFASAFSAMLSHKNTDSAVYSLLSPPTLPCTSNSWSASNYFFGPEYQMSWSTQDCVVTSTGNVSNVHNWTAVPTGSNGYQLSSLSGTNIFSKSVNGSAGVGDFITANISIGEYGVAGLYMRGNNSANYTKLVFCIYSANTSRFTIGYYNSTIAKQEIYTSPFNWPSNTSVLQLSLYHASSFSNGSKVINWYTCNVFDPRSGTLLKSFSAKLLTCGTNCGRSGSFGVLGNGNNTFINFSLNSTVVVTFKSTICVTSDYVRDTVANLLNILLSQITRLSTSCSTSKSGNVTLNTTQISFYLSGDSNTMASSLATNLNNILGSGVQALPIEGNLTITLIPNQSFPIPLSNGGIIGIAIVSTIIFLLVVFAVVGGVMERYDRDDDDL